MSAAPHSSGQSILSQYLRKMRAQGEQNPGNALSPCSPDRAVEASETQKQIWAHACMAGNVPLYNEPVTLSINDGLNIPALEKALHHIVRRHEAWRTAFRQVDNKLMQFVLPEAPFEIPLLDLCGMPSNKRNAVASAKAFEDAKPPFDLSRPPLFRALLVRLTDRNFRLYLTLHHIIFDGVSLYQVFLPELETCYDAFANNAEPSLPQLPIQYRDYCVWQQQSPTDRILEAHLPYWRARLGADLPQVQLKFDRPRPQPPTHNGGTLTFLIAPEVAQAIKPIGQLCGATSYMVFLSAFYALLFHETGQNDLVVGTLSSGRKHESVQRLLGLFWNPVALRIAFRPEQTFLELISQVREVVLDALSNELPFSTLVRQFGRNRNPGLTPLFQIMFSLEPPLRNRKPGWKLTHMELEMGLSKFDLHMELDEREEGLLGRWIYRSDLFDRSTMSRLSQQWAALLKAITLNPCQTLAELSRLCDRSSKQPPETGWIGRSWEKLLRRISAHAY